MTPSSHQVVKIAGMGVGALGLTVARTRHPPDSRPHHSVATAGGPRDIGRLLSQGAPEARAETRGRLESEVLVDTRLRFQRKKLQAVQKQNREALAQQRKEQAELQKRSQYQKVRQLYLAAQAQAQKKRELQEM